MADDAETSEPDRAQVDALLRARKDWPEITRRLILFAMKRGLAAAAARDLAQEAMMRVLDARWRTWDPDKEPDLVVFLQSVMNGKLANDRKTARRHREISIEQEAMTLEDPTRSAEATAASERAHAARFDALRARLAGDAPALRLLELRLEGVDSPADQARAMSVSASELHKVNMRVRYHADVVRRALAPTEETESPRRALLDAASPTKARPAPRTRGHAAARRGRTRMNDTEPRASDEEES